MIGITSDAPEQCRTPREVAITKLNEVETALRGADDIVAADVINAAIDELRSDVSSGEPKESLANVVRSHFKQVAAAADHRSGQQRMQPP